MGEWGGLIYLALPVLLLLLIISRTRKQQREMASVQDRVTTGASVMMASGVFGEVIAIGDDGIITLEVAPGVHTRWTRQAVARVIDEQAPGPITEPGPGTPPDRTG